MNAVRRLIADIGIAIPSDPDLVTAAVALGLSIAAWALAWWIGQRLGPPLATLWEQHAGDRNEGIGPRMCSLVRNLSAAVLLAILLKAYAWPILASFIIGLALAVAVAMLVTAIARGLHLARWIAGSLALVAFVMVLTEAVGDLTPVSEILDQVGFTIGERRFSLLTLLQIGITVLALYAGVKLVNRLVRHSVKRASGLDSTQQLLVEKLVAIGLLVIAFFVGIDLVGIDLTALAVFSGALGLAVGFGLQKTFGNLIAGIILLMDRSIKPGDVISVGQSFGSVNKIGVRAVSIVTREGKEHLIPNEILMTEEVINWSYSTRDVRMSIPVGVGYGADIELAQKLMMEAAIASARVLESPRPNVWLTAFGERSVEHEIRIWIRDPEAGVGSVQSEILNRLWVLFKENGIELPFPQRDIRIKEWPERPESLRPER
ncbi:mechanosensitive ion channel family protein [Sphingosinicella humi]|uniref:mechanosensitive ion channel family protein n=1 Tax=Allosphingosinicella humi TaxID=2068657 RepID=UPI001FB12D78|nr:mechanosensitive ion channel domain-containing protein [Sphingosinicella humi]